MITTIYEKISTYAGKAELMTNQKKLIHIIAIHLHRRLVERPSLDKIAYRMEQP